MPNKTIVLITAAVVILLVAAGLYLDQKGKHPLTNTASVTGTEPSASATTMGKVEFQDYGTAPEFTGISHWLNTEPLTMESLRGKVVLIDFWTYSCINCIRTLPHVTEWYNTYQDKGFVVVGVHTPEFAFEKETGNVQAAIDHFGIHYPVAQDNDYATWGAYSNQYWPAEYLVDKQGRVRYVHFGEGNYDHTENAIRELLGLNDEAEAAASADNLTNVGSPEMYFGTDRLQNLVRTQTAKAVATAYAFPKDLPLNTFALEGSWQFSPQSLTLAGEGGELRLKFHAGKVHLVAASPTSPAEVTITVDGKPQPTVTVSQAELYTLFSSADYTDHVIDIKVQGPGFQAFTLTFG